MTEAASLWAESVREKPSQGDILDRVLIGTKLEVAEYLSARVTMKHGRKGWAVAETWSPDEETAQGYYVSRGRMKAAMILTHSCDLDSILTDHPAQPRILVAPVSLVETISPAARELFETQDSFLVMKLGDVPGLGVSYVDLRNITYVPYRGLDFSKRLASLTERGTEVLQSHLVASFARKGDY